MTQTEQMIQDRIKPYKEKVDALEQRNRELLNLLHKAQMAMSRKGEQPLEYSTFSIEVEIAETIAKHSAPAGQKGGEK